MNFQSSSFKSIKTKEKTCKSCIGVHAGIRNSMLAERSFAALFKRVTVSSLNPRENPLFLRAVLLLLPTEPSRGHQDRPVADSASWRGASTAIEGRRAGAWPQPAVAALGPG